MERQPAKCDDVAISDSSSPSKNLDIDSDNSLLIFCLNPGDPRPVAGDTVTYDIVAGDNGRYYATNIQIVRNTKPVN
jgi:hypothetical protein